MIVGQFPQGGDGIITEEKLPSYLHRDALLSNETAGSLGLNLGSGPTVDDAFSGLMDLFYGGAAIVRLVTKTSDGKVMAGVPIAGAKTISGVIPITDEKGVAYIALSGNTATTVSVGDVIDLTGSVSISAPPFIITEKTLTVSHINYREITSSSIVRISGACTRIDVCCIGGGGGGAQAQAGGGAGGAGGHAVMREDVSFIPNAPIRATVGAGGAPSATKGVPAGRGGDTSILEVTAAGGGGAAEVTPGSGNGAGGYGTTVVGAQGMTGGNGTEYGYNGISATRLYGGGGGGGAFGGSMDATWYGGGGGSPYGGAGGLARRYGAESAGSAPVGTGGGGGGAAMVYGGNTGDGGSGGSGKICLRMWHGEEIV